MAKFSFNGVDGISASFEQLAKLTDDEKRSIIMPAAKLLLKRQKEKILSVFTQRTGDLANSLVIEDKSDSDGVKAFIVPTGKHRGSSTGKRHRKNGRSNGKYSGTNAEVAFILNYGSPRIAATHWLDNANDEAEPDVLAAEEAAWDDLIKEKGL